MPGTLYVDGDACPVKTEAYEIAARHGWPVVLVANAYMAIPRDGSVRLVVVGREADAADDWIAGTAGPGDVVVTADVPLAARCVRVGARVVGPDGRPFTEDSIGLAVAVRDLMTDLRSAGTITGGPKPFAKADRSRFREALHLAILRMARAG